MPASTGTAMLNPTHNTQFWYVVKTHHCSMLDIFEVDGKLAMGANVNEKKLVQRPNLKKMFCISIIIKSSARQSDALQRKVTYLVPVSL